MSAPGFVSGLVVLSPSRQLRAMAAQFDADYAAAPPGLLVDTLVSKADAAFQTAMSVAPKDAPALVERVCLAMAVRAGRVPPFASASPAQ